MFNAMHLYGIRFFQLSLIERAHIQYISHRIDVIAFKYIQIELEIICAKYFIAFC